MLDRKRWADALVNQSVLLACAITLLLLAAAFGGYASRSAPGWSMLFVAGSLGCSYALLGLRASHLAQYWPVLALAILPLLLLIAQLIPLPPQIWHQLPGRALVIEIDKAAGLGAPWRPLSLVPPLTLHALMGVLLPLATLLLAVQLDARHQRRLVIFIVGLILMSGLLAILQTQTPALREMFGYRHGGALVATGLFANRNHQALALVCAVPFAMALLSHYAGRLNRVHRHFSGLVAAAIVLLLFPMILVTGSRAGFVLFCATVGVLPLLWPGSQSRTARPARARAAAALALIAILGSAALLSFENGRAVALFRLIEQDPADEARPEFYRQTAGFLGSYWPAGTGIGTFLPIYAVHEPAATLYRSYVNQAHNDWLDLALTGGAAGILILSAFIGYGLRRGWTLFVAPRKPDTAIIWARTGLVILILAGAASVVDYPLRTPLMMALTAVALVMTQSPARKPDDGPSSDKRRSRSHG
jgi:O-antigen ligase